jgi:hypothetical protein
VDDPGMPLRPIEAVPGEQAHPLAVAPHHQPVAIVLDVVHPLRSCGRPRRQRRDAGLDEAMRAPLRGWGGAEQHDEGNMDPARCACQPRRKPIAPKAGLVR